jgi:outer membrane protein assembly factor BamB
MAVSAANGRKNRILLWVGGGVLLVTGAVLAYAKLDLERYDCDPERVQKLADAVLPSVPSRRTADWPQWRGPNRDGLSTETGLLTSWPPGGPAELWRKPVGRGFSSVAIAGGRLYTMAEETDTGTAGSPRFETVLCLDAATGNTLWRFRYSNHYDERFGPGPRSTPAVDGDSVYAVGPTGIFHCLRADTGAKVWRHDLAEEFHGRPMQYGVAFSPLVEGELVYAMPGGPDGNSIAAFDKRTGRLAWKALDDVVGYSSPVAVTAAGVRQVLFFTNTELVSLAPRDGRVYWRYPWVTAGGFNIATPLAVGDYVLISSAYGKGCALLEITAGLGGAPRVSRVYEHNRLRNHFASSVRFGEHVYGFDTTDLVCMDLRMGRVVWRERSARRFGKGNLLIADGQLIVLGEDGTVTLADATPAGFHAKASCRVSRSKCWTPPALAGGKLYIRDESQIICLCVGSPTGRQATTVAAAGGAGTRK